MCEENYIVYVHTLPNQKVYVGITKRKPNERWQNGNGYKSNKHFYNAIQKYGWKNIEHHILYADLTFEEACEREKELIALFQSNHPNYGYNIAKGGVNEDPNYIGNDEKMPPLDVILQSKKCTELFTALLNSCVPNEVVETMTSYTYEDGVLVGKETKETKRTIEPNLMAIDIILDNYGDEPCMKSFVERIRKIKEQADK